MLITISLTRSVVTVTRRGKTRQHRVTHSMLSRLVDYLWSSASFSCIRWFPLETAWMLVED